MRKSYLQTSNALALLTACAAMVSGCGGGSTTTAEPVSFTTGVDRYFSSGRTDSPERTERLTVDGTSVVTEIDDGWVVTVDGKTVEFDSSELGADPSYPDVYTKRLGEELFGFWSEDRGGFSPTGNPEFEYLDVYGFGRSDILPGADLTTLEPSDLTRSSRLFVVQGVPTADAPRIGTATYRGRTRAFEWDTGSAVFSTRATRYDGSIDITATFGANGSAVRGTFNFTEVTTDGTTNPITDGSVPVDFTTTGSQLSATGLIINTGRFAGYEKIGIHAAAFGPEADEVGGVFEGENPTKRTVMHGYFAAKKGN